MNKLRVFQKVNQRRTVQVLSVRGVCTVLLLFLFLPYLISAFWGNLQEGKEVTALDKQLQTGPVVINRTKLGKEEIPLEIYVADKLARTIDLSYEKEALKAQAVLIRTNLVKEEEDVIFVEDTFYGKEDVPEICYLAAAETKGMILEYENEPIYAAYFKSSSGCTRNAKESFLMENYPYLVSVPCGKDYMAENYYSAVVYTKESFERLWQQIPKLSGSEEELPGMEDGAEKNDAKKKNTGESESFTYIRDSAGYVLQVGYEGEWADGEEMRYLFSLYSSDFQISEEDGDFIFEVTGEGHGLGMSQYAANELAKEGKDFLSLIEYFFEGVKLTKIER